MKKFSVIVSAILLVCVLGLSAFAHSGRTDSDGGHNDNINGGYHYHHGYSAHQHPNGECPYEYEDDTSSSTTLFSLEDFTFEIEEFTFVEPEYPSLYGYTLPEDDTTEETTTEIDYSSHHETNASNSHKGTDNVRDVIKILLGGILGGLYASVCILFAFGLGFILPKKAIIPTIIVICIITTIISIFIVKG